MDLRMPGVEGVQAIDRIRDEDPNAAIIVLTTFDHDEDIYVGLRAGAKAYLLKDVEPEELFRCIRAVHAGEAYLQPKVAAKLAQRVQEEALTEREAQILKLLAEGRSNRAIGQVLAISESTVKSHLKTLFVKLDATSRADVIATPISASIAQFQAAAASGRIFAPPPANSVGNFIDHDMDGVGLKVGMTQRRTQTAGTAEVN